MESVISKEGLDMLLNSLASSISKTKVSRGLGAIKMDAVDKSGFYFGILEILKENSDPKMAAALIIEATESLVQTKAALAEEVIFAEEGDKMVSTMEKALDGGSPTRHSPIFRRIG